MVTTAMPGSGSCTCNDVYVPIGPPIRTRRTLARGPAKRNRFAHTFSASFASLSKISWRPRPMSRFAKAFLLLSAAMLSAGGCTTLDPRLEQEVVVTENGQARSRIVVAADAPPSTKYAAEELQRFLGEMT